MKAEYVYLARKSTFYLEQNCVLIVKNFFKQIAVSILDCWLILV